MTLATLFSRTPQGLEAPLVRVEVDVGAGLPSFSVVGLLETAVKESKDRVRAALANCGYEFPAGRVTVNLAPADLPKEGGRFDLAIAVGIPSRRSSCRRDPSRCQAVWRVVIGVSCTARVVCCPVRCRRRVSHVLIVPPEWTRSGARKGTRVRRAHLQEVCRHAVTGRHGDQAQVLSPPLGGDGAVPTWPTCAARQEPAARSRSRPPANTACC
jgi:magnesium chelatase family protein